MAVLAQVLKESVLQSALQGNLSKRSSDDTEVKETLKELQSAKTELCDSGKILKKKPTSPFFNDSEYPFEIPESWEWVQLSDVSIIQEGAGIRKHQYANSGIQLLCVTNILNGLIDLENKKIFVTKEEYEEKYKHLTPVIGDIVTACSGGSWGKVAIYNSETITMLNTSTLRMRFFKDLANNKYLYYVAQSTLFKRQLAKQLVGMQPNFGYAHYSRICFPFPPIEEQQRIVEKLEEILPQIDEYEKTEMKLEALKKEFPSDIKAAILQAAIRGKLTEQLESDSSVEDNIRKIEEELENYRGKKIEKLMITDDEIPFEIPSDWRFVRLGEVCKKIHYGYTASAQSKGNVRLLRITDIQDNFVDWKTVPYCDVTTDEYEKYGLNNRDIMIARTGGTIGKTYIVESLDDKSVFASYLIRAIPSNYINEKYLKKFMESPSYWKQLIDFSNGTGQPNVNAASLGKLIVPLPPIEEQERIVEKLEQFLPLCDDLK